MATQPPVTGDGVFRDDVVRIAALTVTSLILEGLTFIDCQIVGPAVLLLLEDVRIDHSQFEADLDSIFWDVPPTRAHVIGAVGVRNVNFSRCAFRSIGFAGNQALREAFERGV